MENLIPGRNQVGAMMKSLGFPVLSGHAHPFPGIAPFHFFSRGTSCINHAQSRGLLAFHLCIYVCIIYIPESTENGKNKKRKTHSWQKNFFIFTIAYPNIREAEAKYLAPTLANFPLNHIQ